MRRPTISRLLAGTALAAGLAIAPATAAHATTTYFYGYGYLPSDAYNDAKAQMEAYSPTCQEISVTYSEAGSEHYWKATLTADC
jgi:hypothetical protein